MGDTRNGDEKIRTLTVDGTSANGWVSIRREPSGHFQVVIRDPEFTAAREADVCREIESAIRAVQEDFRRQYLKIPQRRLLGRMERSAA